MIYTINVTVTSVFEVGFLSSSTSIVVLPTGIQIVPDRPGRITGRVSGGRNPLAHGHFKLLVDRGSVIFIPQRSANAP